MDNEHTPASRESDVSRKEASSSAKRSPLDYSQSATRDTDTEIKIYYYDRVSYRKQRGDGGPSSRSFTCVRLTPDE